MKVSLPQRDTGPSYEGWYGPTLPLGLFIELPREGEAIEEVGPSPMVVSNRFRTPENRSCAEQHRKPGRQPRAIGRGRLGY